MRTAADVALLKGDRRHAGTAIVGVVAAFGGGRLRHDGSFTLDGPDAERNGVAERIFQSLAPGPSIALILRAACCTCVAWDDGDQYIPAVLLVLRRLLILLHCAKGMHVNATKRCDAPTIDT